MASTLEIKLRHLLAAWERRNQVLEEKWRELFLADEDALFLAGFDYLVVCEAIDIFGPKLADIRHGIEQVGLDPESWSELKRSGWDGAGPLPTTEKPSKGYKAHEGNQGRYSVADFRKLWISVHGRVPIWDEDELEQIAQICTEHEVGHVKSSIRAEQRIKAIADRCADLASGRNPRDLHFIYDEVFERDMVNPPPRSSGIGPIQNYGDDT